MPPVVTHSYRFSWLGHAAKQWLDFFFLFSFVKVRKLQVSTCIFLKWSVYLFIFLKTANCRYYLDFRLSSSAIFNGCASGCHGLPGKIQNSRDVLLLWPTNPSNFNGWKSKLSLIMLHMLFRLSDDLNTVNFKPLVLIYTHCLGKKPIKSSMKTLKMWQVFISLKPSSFAYIFTHITRSHFWQTLTISRPATL